MREDFREDVEAQLQKGVETKDSYRTGFQKTKFLEKFFLYKGVSRKATESGNNILETH